MSTRALATTPEDRESAEYSQSPLSLRLKKDKKESVVNFSFE